MNTTPILLEYVRKESNKDTKSRGEPVGVVVALGPTQIGWSYTHSNEKGGFNKSMGIRIATGRASVGTNKRMPLRVIPVYEKMMDRARKYFKPVMTAPVE